MRPSAYQPSALTTEPKSRLTNSTEEDGRQTSPLGLDWQFEPGPGTQKKKEEEEEVPTRHSEVKDRSQQHLATTMWERQQTNPSQRKQP